jgi:hypothetical protein
MAFAKCGGCGGIITEDDCGCQTKEQYGELRGWYCPVCDY